MSRERPLPPLVGRSIEPMRAAVIDHTCLGIRVLGHPAQLGQDGNMIAHPATMAHEVTADRRNLVLQTTASAAMRSAVLSIRRRRSVNYRLADEAVTGANTAHCRIDLHGIKSETLVPTPGHGQLHSLKCRRVT
jgi:hypothetical protein